MFKPLNNTKQSFCVSITKTDITSYIYYLGIYPRLLLIFTCSCKIYHTDISDTSKWYSSIPPHLPIQTIINDKILFIFCVKKISLPVLNILTNNATIGNLKQKPTNHS